MLHGLLIAAGHARLSISVVQDNRLEPEAAETECITFALQLPSAPAHA